MRGLSERATSGPSGITTRAGLRGPVASTTSRSRPPTTSTHSPSGSASRSCQERARILFIEAPSPGVPINVSRPASHRERSRPLQSREPRVNPRRPGIARARRSCRGLSGGHPPYGNRTIAQWPVRPRFLSPHVVRCARRPARSMPTATSRARVGPRAHYAFEREITIPHALRARGFSASAGARAVFPPLSFRAPRGLGWGWGRLRCAGRITQEPRCASPRL